MSAFEVRWVTAFLDRPDSTIERSVEFWRTVTGWGLSPWRGDRDEFATFLPPHGDPSLRVQRVDAGAGGVHIDLHVDDPHAAARRAVAVGAEVLGEPDGYVVLRSPGGLTFCVVSHHGENDRPASHRIHAGAASLVDQVCIDTPPRLYDGERSFWSALTGWPAVEAWLPGFCYLDAGPTSMMRIILQREDDERSGGCHAHLDLSCGDVDSVAEQHVDIGAALAARHEHWAIMHDPSGQPYCLLARTPRI